MPCKHCNRGLFVPIPTVIFLPKQSREVHLTYSFSPDLQACRYRRTDIYRGHRIGVAIVFSVCVHFLHFLFVISVYCPYPPTPYYPPQRPTDCFFSALRFRGTAGLARRGCSTNAGLSKGTRCMSTSSHPTHRSHLRCASIQCRSCCTLRRSAICFKHNLHPSGMDKCTRRLRAITRCWACWRRPCKKF